VHCGGFRRHGASGDASSPVEADPAIAVVHDGAVIDADVGDVYVVDGAVVVEATPAPVSALIAGAAVTESVVDATVESDILTP